MAIIALGSLLALGPVAQAQDKKPDAAPNAPAGRRAAGGQDQLKRITEELKLTDEQAAKLKPILKEEIDKLRALRQDTSLSRQDRAAKTKEIRDAVTGKVKPILTADQVEKWNKFREQGQRQGRRRQQP